jgi:hypothetical protein
LAEDPLANGESCTYKYFQIFIYFIKNVKKCWLEPPATLHQSIILAARLVLSYLTFNVHSHRSDPATHNTVGYGSNWMQLSLDGDSKDECILDPHKELTEYLESMSEEQKEGLVEWWGVSMAHKIVTMSTNRSLD